MVAKFRVWKKDTRELIYPDGNGYFIPKEGLAFVMDGNGEAINLDHLDTPDHIEFLQYSGLEDSDNKEIYAGDIVYLAGYGNYVAEFPFTELYDSYAEGDIGKILGNIYENPGLEDKELTGLEALEYIKKKTTVVDEYGYGYMLLMGEIYKYRKSYGELMGVREFVEIDQKYKISKEEILVD